MDRNTAWVAIIEQDYFPTDPKTGEEADEAVSIPIGKVTCHADNAQLAHNIINKWIDDYEGIQQSGRIASLECINQITIHLNK